MSTAPPTTAPPSTVAPTTVAPTTLAPTTVAPTTVPDITLTVDPIEIIVAPPYAVWHYWPPAPVNPGLDQEYDFGDIPIELDFTVLGSPGNVGIEVSPIEVEIIPASDGFTYGRVITPDPINIVISIPSIDVLLDYEECNWVWWSKIGELDFTIDESNIAGKRPMDWRGCVWHVARLGDKVGIYGDNGVSFIRPSGIHFGLDTIYRIGLKNKGAFVDGEKYHFFIDKLNQLCQVDKAFKILDYKEFLSTMSTTILSLDEEQELLYITDGTYGYVYSIKDESFGTASVNITGIGAQNSLLYVTSDGAIDTPKFEICTDIYDLGTRKPKTVQRVELGTDVGEFLHVSLDYRNNYREEFKQIGWFIANHDGKAYPKCYGVEFRIRVKASIREYLELDYIKVRGHIHGYSYLDTAEG